MLPASPITNQPVGKTFTTAIGLLGLGALLELGLIGWAFWQRPPIALVPQPGAGMAQLSSPPAVVGHPATPGPAASLVGEPSSELLDKGPESAAATPPKPTPVVSRPANTEPNNRFEEILTQGRELRDRGDTSTAITKFREAAAMDPKSAVPLAELATTYEKMGLTEKAAENYGKIIEMGPNAGPYYQMAEAKRQLSQARAMNQVVASQTQTSPTSSPEQGVDTSTPVDGIAVGAVLGLLPVSIEELHDDNSAKRFILHVPIKARPKARIDVKDLIIHVLFYDIVDGQNVVQTNATVNYKWITQPPDWVNSDTEELAAEYNLPKPAKRENRKYYGYIVRIYYKGQLQAATAEPERLAQQYPPPSTLPKDNTEK
jgi:hypothetical protein